MKSLPENEVFLSEREGIQVLSLSSPDYPEQFKKLKKPPECLWVKGDLSLLKRTLGVVGTRNATLYGKETAYSWAKKAAERGAVIVSGLARGIDTAAHEGALDGGRTVAIIGSGLNHIYPTENQKLAEKIGERGLLISEYPPLTPPKRHQFPERNRLIAALSDQLLVIEAPLKSGALLTVQESLLLNRPVFALPGRVDWPNFEGGHLLIKEGKAKMATTIDDLIAGRTKKNILEKNEPLLALLGETEKDVETLMTLSNLPLPRLHAELMRLLLQGKIKEFPGRVYKKS